MWEQRKKAEDNRISFSHCAERFPFLGKVRKVRDDICVELIVRHAGDSAQGKCYPFASSLPEKERPELGRVILYAINSRGEVVDWVYRKGVRWKTLMPNSQEEYAEYRAKHFRTFDPEKLEAFLRGRQKPTEEDPGIRNELEYICWKHLKKLDLESEEFGRLAEAICREPCIGPKVVHKAIQEKILIISSHKSLPRMRTVLQRIHARTQSLSEILLWLSALALDVEADRQNIRQIGWCFGPEEKEGGEALLASLADRLASAPLIVGHNILAWDKPQLEKAGCQFPEGTPIWDTLLVSFLLEPWKASHALGGAHRALDDAKKCRDLFLEQAQRIGLEKALEAIQIAQGNGTIALLRELVRRIPAWETPAPPEWTENLQAGDRVAVPDAWLTSAAWCPGIAAGKQEGFLEVDPGLVQEEQNHTDDPAYFVMLEVLRRAWEAGIVVHKDMIPPWLRDRKEIGDLLEAIKSNEDRDDTGNARVIPLSDLSEHKLERVQRIVSHMQRKGGHITLPAKWENSDPGKDPNTLVIKDHFCEEIGSAKPWKVFKRIRFDGEWQRPRESPESPLNYRIARWNRPVLFPNSRAVQDYWVETLARFLAIASKEKEQNKQVSHAVPVLFVDAEGRVNRQGRKDIDLVSILTAALVQLGKADDPEEYHSRSRRLQMAMENGRVLVAPRSEMHEWLALANDAGIPLLPVIESLPLEEWWLRNQKNGAKSEGGSDDDDGIMDALDASDEEANEEKASEEPPDVDQEPVTPSRPKRKEKLAEQITYDANKLVKQYLAAWLKDQAGPWGGKFRFIIIDPRAQTGSSDQLLECHADFFRKEQKSIVAEVFEQYSIRGEVEYETPPERMDDLRDFVKDAFFQDGKFEDFHEYQREPIGKILEGGRNLALLVRLPTGAGKSLIFQAPALFRRNESSKAKRLTLVISPLKALMEDQVSKLHEYGFEDEVEYLSSDRPWWEISQVFQGVLDGTVSMLYIAPERFRSKVFMDVLQRRMERDGGLEYLVFDEAHCISQWGHEFRPDYLYAARKVAELRKRYEFPILLFSATVPDATKEDIRKALGLGEGELTLSPEDQTKPIRKEIKIEPIPVGGTVLEYKEEEWNLDERLSVIEDEIKRADENSAVIVFVQRRVHAEVLAHMLNDRLKHVIGEGKVAYYHAGVPADERKEIYERYKNKEVKVLVATKAFGMGMDIGHIHHCIHLSPPNYLEDYLQEVGRIGRDGKKPHLPAKLIYSDADWQRCITLNANGRMQVQTIRDFWDALQEIRKETGTGHIIALPVTGNSKLPEDPFQKGSASSRSAKVRMALYWLEKAGRVEILRTLPSLVEVSIQPEKLLNKADDRELDDNTRAVAKAILDLHGISDDKASDGTHDGEGPKSWVDRVVDAIGSFIGFFFGGKKEREKEWHVRHSEKQRRKGMLDLDALGGKCGLTTDKVLEAIRELARDKAVDIETTLEISPGWLVKEAGKERLLEGLDKGGMEALEALKSLHGQVLDWNKVQFTFVKSPEDKLNPKLHRAQEKALLKLLRLAGGRRERFREADGSIRHRVIFKSFPATKRSRCKRVISLARRIWSSMPSEKLADRNAGGISIKLSDLLKCAGNSPRIQEIEAALDLLKCLGLIQVSNRLLPMSYLLELKEPDAPLDLQAIVQDIQEVNEMSEMRVRAMQALCYINPDRARSEFLPRYFRCGKSKELRDFLVGFLYEEARQEKVDDAARDKLIRLREQIDPEYIRQQFDKVLGKHRDRDKQWDVITHPIEQHLLVNAGPGAGKTSVLIARIVYLIHEKNVRPNEIMVLAFNRAVVQEIRKRVRDVFEKVGYGPYVRSLRVSTFHALATSRLRKMDKQFEPGKALATYASLLIRDPEEAKQAAGNVRTILVDEFQDMNDSRWMILTGLQKANNARIFAIGDDDQDIVAWDEERNGKGCSEYFESFKKCFNPEVLHLTTNFRSAEEIVCRSQAMVGKLVQNREKKEIKLTSFRKDAGEVTRETNCTEAHVLHVLQRELQEAKSAKESVAILCRTNAEVAEWHEKLKKEFPCLKVQGSAKYQLAWLRHVAVWLDILESIEKEKGNPPLVNALKENVFTHWKKKDIPEARDVRNLSDPQKSAFYRQLCNLWDWCVDDNPNSRVRDLIEFVNDLTTDDYDRMEEQQSSDSKGFHAVISTVHKVKGLEFDRVVIPPSQAPFPLTNKKGVGIATEAEAEAKTYYVAMTRAKTRLVYFVGAREKAWAGKKKYNGGPGGKKEILYGEPGELVISWAGFSDRNMRNGDNDWLQKCIESSVAVGDKITVEERKLIWGTSKIEVGLLTERLSRKKTLSVAAVLRFPQKRDMSYFQKNPEEFDKLTETVQKRGWLWLVCVQG